MCLVLLVLEVFVTIPSVFLRIYIHIHTMLPYFLIGLCICFSWNCICDKSEAWDEGRFFLKGCICVCS